MANSVYEITGAVELAEAFKKAPEIVEKVGARAIAWKIKAHGTKGAKMFARAFEANKGQVERILSVVPAQVAREIKKAAKQ